MGPRSTQTTPEGQLAIGQMGAEKKRRCLAGLIKGDHAQAEAGGLA